MSSLPLKILDLTVPIGQFWTADLIVNKFRRICIVRDLKIRPINHHTSGIEEASSIACIRLPDRVRR